MSDCTFAECLGQDYVPGREYWFDVLGNVCYRRDDGSVSVENCTCSPSMADPSFADDVDINNILSKYISTGVMGNVNNRQPIFGDFSDIVDYGTAMQHVITAQDSFMTLPSNVRKRFGNDPQMLMEFISDKANYDEAVKLGLIPPAAAAKQPSTATGDIKTEA